MKKGKLVSKILAVALAFVLVGTMLGGLPALVGKVEASPATIYVLDDGPAIQAAADTASAGDATIMSDGAYATTSTYFMLTVDKIGSGTITSNPAGINCGTDCSELYEEGTWVDLTATADNGWISMGFTCDHITDEVERQLCELERLRWEMDRASTSHSTRVLMDQAKNITFSFVPGGMVEVSKIGSGTIVSSPSGIDCGCDCREPFFGDPRAVTLTALPATGATFLGWEGDCSGSGDCILDTGHHHTDVVARFTEGGQYMLAVNKIGSGTVTSSPAGIDCGSDCSEPYEDGTPVTLTFSPHSGWGIHSLRFEGSCTWVDQQLFELEVLRYGGPLPTYTAKLDVLQPETVTVCFVPVDTPIARPSDISGQPQAMYPNTEYTVAAKYFDPDGREDLKYCYLRLNHPDKPLTMMWNQATDDFWTYAGEEGANYLTVTGTSTPITDGSLEGYELAWRFTINDQWPEVENAIDFGVYAWDDADHKTGWNYDATKASFLLTILPDLWITDIKPVQVTWSPDINGDGKPDLVAGKSTMVRVYVGMTGHEELPEDTPVEVELVFDGIRYWKPTTIGELQANNHVDFYPYAPGTLGDQTITATVDPPNWIKESDETNNDGDPIEISVKDTTGLYVHYVAIDGPMPNPSNPWEIPGYGPIDMAEFSNTVSQSGRFISATYPVAEAELTNHSTNSKYYGINIPFYTSIMADAAGIWLQGELETATKADVSVGIAPVDYFTYHLLPECPEEYMVKGAAFPGIDGVITTVGYWTAPAHEVGHKLGLRLDEEEYHIEEPGKEAEGFWVVEHREISNGACFMGRAGAYGSFNHKAKYDERPIWVCDEDYAKLFGKMRPDPADPDVLLLSGMISKNGTVELGRFFMVQNGQADPPEPGDYSIEILDTQAQVLMNIPFYTAFKAYLGPYDTLDIDYAGFTLAIPYPEATSRITIQHNGENLAEINPNTGLLHDAIDSIPDHGFLNNPDQRRNALHTNIDAVERMIEAGSLNPAIHVLERNVKHKLEKWLVDDYSVETPLQLTKLGVLTLVQTIIERLASQSR